MQDGQIQNIPLTSGLDVHTNDMLVPIQRPTFLHNRQNYQNHMLPNSLRFEHDGWAAGHNVYNFKFTDSYVTTGDKIVTKSKLYDNPTYRLALCDSDGKEKASCYFTPSNSIKSTTADNVKVNGINNPTITGYFNGKYFELTFDSLDLSKKPVLVGNDISFYNDGYTLSDTCVGTTQLKDDTVTLTMTFKGLTLPENIINHQNGLTYELGKFSAFGNRQSVWVNNGSTISLVDNELVLDINGTEVKATVTDNVDADGSYSNSTAVFGVPLQFFDSPTVATAEYYPYFEGVSISRVNTTTQMSAPDSIPFNVWNVEITDKDNGDSFDYLYRNFTTHGAPSNEYNKQTVVQEIPVWFGINAKGGFTVDTTGKSSSDVVGRVVTSATQTIVPSYLDGSPLKYRAVIELKTTENCRRYDNAFTPNVRVYEQSIDKSDEYLQLASRSGSLRTVPVVVEYDYYGLNSDTDEYGYIHSSKTLYLEEDYSNLDKATEMVSVRYQKSTDGIEWKNCDTSAKYLNQLKNVTATAGKIEGTVTLSAEYTVSGKWIKNAGKVIVSGSGAKIEPPTVKGQIDETTSCKYKWAGVNSTSEVETAYWGVCTTGYVVSSLYLNDTDTLSEDNITGAFTIEKYDSDNSKGYRKNLFNDQIFLDDDTYGTNFLKHTVYQITSGSTVSVTVRPIAIQNNYFYALYCTPSDYSASVNSYLPSHFITGKLKNITDSSIANVGGYAISKTYTTTSVDTNYSIYFDVQCTVAQSANGSYNYISSCSANIDSTQLVSGNRFTDTIAPDLVDSLDYVVASWQGYFDKTSKSYKGAKQLVSLEADGSKLIEFVYNLDNSIPILSRSSYTYKDYPVTVIAAAQESEDSMPIKHIQFTHNIAADDNTYYVTFVRPFLIENTDTYGVKAAGYTLVSLKDDVATILTNDGRYVQLNYVTKQAYVSFDGGANYVESTETFYDGEANKVDIDAVSYVTIVSSLFGVYNLDNVKLVGVSQDVLQLKYNDSVYTVNLSENGGLFDPSKYPILDFYCTDTRKEELEDKQIQRVNTENEFQFLKQQWDTDISTENFWWLDSKHILTLDNERFILKKKTDELHDWNGDVWEEQTQWSRFDYVTSDTKKYWCSSAYNGATPRFITLTNGTEGFIVTVYNPLSNMKKSSFNLKISKRDIGKELNPNAATNIDTLNTYSTIILDSFFAKAKTTSTVIGKYLFIGFHYDNNYNQWTVKYNLETEKVDMITQGYGFVGLNGTLTGGELPIEYCDDYGFNSIVVSFKDGLNEKGKDANSLNDIYALTEQVVGDEFRQWYIRKNITGVVSHFTYDSDKDIFVKHNLLLNNNYSVCYDSASFVSAIFSDFDFQVRSLSNLIDGNASSAWKTFMVGLMYPMIYYLAPKATVANYLQQTLGQSAYVHYNSTNVRVNKKDIVQQGLDSDLTLRKFNQVADMTGVYTKGHEQGLYEYDLLNAQNTSELTFDRLSVKQTASCKDPYSSLIAILVTALVSALQTVQEGLQVNFSKQTLKSADKNSKDTEKTGNNVDIAFTGTPETMSAFLQQNLYSMLTSSMTMSALTPTQTSEVTAMKFLDMFYSTSDNQNIYAGAGYVNHNFIAQCTAYSVTSTQTEMMQNKILCVLKGLTYYQIKLTNYMLHLAADKVKIMMDANNASSVHGAMSAIASPGWYVSVALGAANVALTVACKATDIALDFIPGLLDTLAPSGMTCNTTHRLSVHNIDVEDKHRYGFKTETFMWPAFGVDAAQEITDESVVSETLCKTWKLSMPTGKPRTIKQSESPAFTTKKPGTEITQELSGSVPMYMAMVKGVQKKVTLPDKMAYVIGSESILPQEDFKNENIGAREPSFSKAITHDYIIDERWQLGITAGSGQTWWVSCKDTKLTDGDYSNLVVSSDFCGVATPYTAIEVKRGIRKEYLRPWALTTEALVLNNTGLNCCYKELTYHAFDGYGARIVNWLGSPDIQNSYLTTPYTFIINDRLKRSNRIALNQFSGNFRSEPTVAYSVTGSDRLYNSSEWNIANIGKQDLGTIGEAKDNTRYALPVFSEFVSNMPAAIKTISSYPLCVIDGITTLTANAHDTNSLYKAPLSIDFIINRQLYRVTSEYICTFDPETNLVSNQVACIGLKYLGSTPYAAYFYSQDCQQYYSYTGGSALTVVNDIERFRNVTCGRYDFINQEVVLPCLASFKRLDKMVENDDSEVDNIIVPRLLEQGFIGEVAPPITTIFNERSWFRVLSLPSGVTYQGPNRCIINRFVYSNYMTKQIKDNLGLWERLPRENYHPFRIYKKNYEKVDEQIGKEDGLVPKGWTHNPYLLVTAPLGVNDSSDCLFEWEITFAWTEEMDKLYGANNYAVVNMWAETMTPGGKVIAPRPTHVYLTKELFTRTGNYGYYSFRYQGKNGQGNRERLHIWSDQYIAISRIQIEYKTLTSKRTEQLTQNLDVQRLVEL